MRDDVAPPGFAAQRDGFDGLAYRADLVQLDQHRVRRVFFYPALDERGISYEDIVTNDLDAVPLRFCLSGKARPSFSSSPSSIETIG